MAPLKVHVSSEQSHVAFKKIVDLNYSFFLHMHS